MSIFALKSWFFILFATIIGLSCLVKTPENNIPGENPVELAKKSPVSRQIPFNEQSPDQYLAPGQEFPVDNSIRQGQLSNGLKYYIKNNPTPDNRLELRLAVKAGSVLEEENQRGFAHFIEHMAFNGTKSFKKNDLIKYLESIGTRFGPDLNAYTSFEETLYMLQLRSDVKGQIDTGLIVLRDWAGGINFDLEEVEKEKGVVLSEWRSGLSASQRFTQQYLPVKYKDSRYAERLPIGVPEVIEKANLDDIKKFYSDWYRPEFMAVVAIGDIDVDQMESEIISTFKSLSTRPGQKEKPLFPIPAQSEMSISVLTDEEAPFTDVRIDFRLPKEIVKDQKSLKKNFEKELFVRMLNARFEELSMDPDAPFTFAYNGFYDDLGEWSNFTQYALSGEDQILSAYRALLTELERVKRFGFLPEELDRQKREILKEGKSALREQNNTESNMIASKCVNHFFYGSPMLSPSQNYNFQKLILPQIDLQMVNMISQKYMDKNNMFVVVTGPQKTGVSYPEHAHLHDIYDEVKRNPLEPYEEELNNEPLFNKETGKGVIVSQMEFKELGIDYVKFNNGVQVFLKQTDFKKDEVLFACFGKGGTSLYEYPEHIQANFASELVLQSGLGQFTAIDLMKKLSGKKIELYPFIGQLHQGINGSCTPEDMETALQLINLYITEPRFDSTAFQTMVNQNLNIFQNLYQNPQYWFYDQLEKLKYNGDPRAGFPSIEEIKALDLKMMEEIYRKAFSDVSGYTFVFVGNINKFVLFSRLSKYLGSIPAQGGNLNWEDPDMNIRQGVIKQSFKKGKTQKATVQLVWHGDFEWNAENRNSLYLLNKVLNTRLREILREDQGAVYGVQLGVDFTQFPFPEYGIEIGFNCDPDKTSALIELVNLEINRLKSEFVEQEYLINEKKKAIETRQKERETNNFWRNSLVFALQNKEDLDQLRYESYAELINNVDQKKIRNAAIKYFDMQNHIEAVLLPEKDIE